MYYLTYFHFCSTDYLKDMTMEEASTHFRIRTRTFNCKMNQSSDPKHRAELWKCSACGNIDSQSHILWCDAYSKLREGKSLDNDRDIAQYYYKVMLIREKLKLKAGDDDWKKSVRVKKNLQINEVMVTIPFKEADLSSWRCRKWTFKTRNLWTLGPVT